MTQAEFRPFVPPEESPAELTPRAVVLGVLLGIVFGAASVYLALKVGITTSASVPIAVLSIAVLKKLGRSTILENNIVQTVGSAGESIAAAVVFTVPALIFLDERLDVGRTLLIALIGGVLGVLMMVPLRRYLIVQEHGELRFPEGTACAEILKAGEKTAGSARKIFVGLGFAALYKACTHVFGVWKGVLNKDLAFFRGSNLGLEASPELLGVGYIIGFRTSVIMVAGGLLSSFVLGPTIAFFGQNAAAAIDPAEKVISAMSPGEIWAKYVRYIGAGAVAAGGIVGLVRALPSIVGSAKASLALFRGRGATAGAVPRTERDTPMPVVLVGSLALVALIWAIPMFQVPLLGAALIVLFGFLFSAVSARITGLVGSSSCPLSGMTIAVVMGTCLIFLGIGWSGPEYRVLALMIGAVVCIAISNAGTTAQDLKTGHLVGATPVRQQMGLLIGVVTSASIVGFTVLALNASKSKDVAVEKPFVVPAAASIASGHAVPRVEGAPAQELDLVWMKGNDATPTGNYLVDPATREARYRRVDGVGSPQFPAPQATLMATVIDGLLKQKLPWTLISIGVAIALFMELLGMHSLTFAVGVYLPLSSTMPIFLGGCVRWLADRVYRRKPDDIEETEGTLFSSGLIAGGAIVGVLAALLGLGVEAHDFFAKLGMDVNLDFHVGTFDDLDPNGDNSLPKALAFGPKILPSVFESAIPTLVAFAGLGWLLFRGARDSDKR